MYNIVQRDNLWFIQRTPLRVPRRLRGHVNHAVNVLFHSQKRVLWKSRAAAAELCAHNMYIMAQKVSYFFIYYVYAVSVVQKLWRQSKSVDTWYVRCFATRMNAIFPYFSAKQLRLILPLYSQERLTFVLHSPNFWTSITDSLSQQLFHFLSFTV